MRHRLGRSGRNRQRLTTCERDDTNSQLVRVLTKWIQGFRDAAPRGRARTVPPEWCDGVRPLVRCEPAEVRGPVLQLLRRLATRRAKLLPRHEPTSTTDDGRFRFPAPAVASSSDRRGSDQRARTVARAEIIGQSGREGVAASVGYPSGRRPTAMRHRRASSTPTARMA
jgi:hypothetical protein